jgi:hypothetical protein
VKDPAGGVKGVRSSSNDEPFKKDNFPEEYDTFVDRGKYSEWEFSYTPEKTRAGSTAGAGVPKAAGNLPAN